MGKHSAPNLRVPLVPSINGDTANFSGGQYDTQIVVNAVHDTTSNEKSGEKTTYLQRRPGWNTSQSSYGTTTKVPWLMFRRPSDAGASWMAAYDTGGAQVVTDGTTNTTLFTDTNYAPNFVTVANLAGSAKAVIQCRKDFSTAQRVFYGSAIGAWTEITDAVFTALVHRGKMEFLDAHMFVLASDRNIYNCKVNDIATWPAGNLIPKSIKLDIPSGLILHKNVLLAMGNESAEGFQTDGSNNPSGSVLSRIKQLTANIGLAQNCGNGNVTASGLGSYYATVGEFTFFLGNERSSRLSAALYAFNGSSFEKVASNDFIAKLFSNGTPAYNLVPFCWHGRRGVAFQMTQPSLSGTQRWWVFDVDWKQWYMFESSEFMPINDGENFAGASNSRDELMQPSRTSFADGLSGATVYDSYVQFELPNDTGERKRMAWYGVLGETAQGTSTTEVLFSDNDAYTTYTSRGTIDMQSAFKRLYRGGSFTRRMVRLKHSTDREWKIREFQARITG